MRGNTLTRGWLAALAALWFVGCDRHDNKAENTGPAPAAAPNRVITTQASTINGMPAPTPQKPEFTAFVPPTRPAKEIQLAARSVAVAPTIDGIPNDEAWKDAQEIQTLDFSSQRPITLKSIHTADEIFFLVTYPDAAPSTTHKSWLWDDKEEVYKPLGDREDMLILKWSLSGNAVNLSFRDAQPHRGDIWFWKAARTNPIGYLDDKWQELRTAPVKDAVNVPSPKQGTLYLVRNGDSGDPAYTEAIPMEYRGKMVTNFTCRPPAGSRADIRAKGVWNNGLWTIEMGRKLNTGHDDDVQFTVGGTYLFGATCYEMSFTPLDPDTFQPLYKTGDVFDRLMLHIDQ